MKHIFTGIMVIILLVTIAAIGLAIICATPVIVAFAIAISILALIYCILWSLGFTVNTGRDGIKKLRKNRGGSE
jgi:uncharacterized membrane protein